MSNSKGTKIFIIRNKVSLVGWTAPSGNSTWKAVGHAKSAWATMCGGYDTAEYYGKKYGVSLVPTGYKGKLSFPRFDEQDVYEIVEVNTLAGDLVDDLRQLIERLLESVPDDKKEQYIRQYKELVGE